MKMTIGCVLDLEDVPSDLEKKIKDYCTVPNPMYFKLMKMGNTKALYACKKEFRYWEERTLIPEHQTTSSEVCPGRRVLSVWRGLEERIRDYCRRAEIRLEIIDQRSIGDLRKNANGSPSEERPGRTGAGSGLVLRDYQVGSFEEFAKYENGVAHLGTGWGKSALALKLYETRDVPTLIAVPRLDIKEQFIKDARRFLSIAVGGIDSEEGHLVIETYQTLIRRELSPERFGMVIVDECHLAVPEKTRQFIQNLRPYYLYGLSATPAREDGQGKAIELLFGPTRVTGDIPRGKPKVKIIDYWDRIPVCEYAEMVEMQTEDEVRNDIIAQEAVDQVKAGHDVLILTKRRAHYDYIEKAIERCDPSVRTLALDSAARKKDRSETMAELRAGTSSARCLLGTFSLLSTGIDIPKLSCLIIAGDLKSRILSHQSAGRILRLFEGKKDPLIIDIQDKKNPILRRQGNLRRAFYELQGWDIL